MVKRSVNDAACYSYFTAFSIDGKEMARGMDYTSHSGSTVIDIEPSALEKLAIGEHQVTVYFKDGKASTKLTIKVKDDVEKPLLYHITYVLDGGVNAPGNPDSYVPGVGVASFGDATRQDATFEGWYSDQEFTNRVVAIPADCTGDVILFAKFTGEPRQLDQVPKTGDSSADLPLAAGLIAIVSAAGIVWTERKKRQQ